MAKLSWLPKMLEPAMRGYGLLAGVDQVGIDLVFGRERADAQHAVFALQRRPRCLRATWLATSVGMPMPRLT